MRHVHEPKGVSALDKHQNWSASALFCHNSQAQSKYAVVKGIFSDSNNIFLWHKSEDINKKRLFPKFQLILILRS